MSSDVTFGNLLLDLNMFVTNCRYRPIMARCHNNIACNGQIPTFAHNGQILSIMANSHCAVTCMYVCMYVYITMRYATINR